MDNMNDSTKYERYGSAATLIDALGIKNGKAFLENTLAILHKVKHWFTLKEKSLPQSIYQENICIHLLYTL